MGVGSSFPEGGIGRGTPPMKEQTETQLLCGERGRAGGEAAPAATWQIGRGQGTKGGTPRPGLSTVLAPELVIPSGTELWQCPALPALLPSAHRHSQPHGSLVVPSSAMS